MAQYHMNIVRNSKPAILGHLQCRAGVSMWASRTRLDEVLVDGPDAIQSRHCHKFLHVAAMG